jgi:uncharacterized SAM-binding protein YcdF (DUF218 family)
MFETRKTRSQRIISASFFSIFFVLVCFALLTVYLPIFANNQNDIAKEAFFQRAPDVIVVFTGDTGRIDYTFKKAEKYPSSKVFITGVYAKNSLKTLLFKQGKDISVEDYLNQESHHIELEYLARNTIENGLATLRYLKKLDAHKNVLIISSDYHMFRISKIMEALSGKNSKFSFFYESIKTDYSSRKNISKLIKEVYKFFKTSTFLMFWDRGPGKFVNESV